MTAAAYFHTPDPDPDPVDQEAEFNTLVRATISSVPGARDRLLGQLQPLVLRYCRSRIGQRESVMGSADDVAQEVCLAVVAALPSYQLKGLSFRAFVYGIAAHKVADAYRAMGRNKCDPVPELPDAPVLNDGPEQQLLAHERLEQLSHLLDLLTPRQREVLVLRIAVGMSAEETAAAVGSTPGAVRVTQHRALNRLRAEIGDRGLDGPSTHRPGSDTDPDNDVGPGGPVDAA